MAIDEIRAVELLPARCVDDEAAWILGAHALHEAALEARRRAAPVLVDDDPEDDGGMAALRGIHDIDDELVRAPRVELAEVEREVRVAAVVGADLLPVHRHRCAPVDGAEVEQYARAAPLGRKLATPPVAESLVDFPAESNP
ncbi:MAG: hypothetical protein WKF65_07430 [Gaiellaceae bacterium]